MNQYVDSKQPLVHLITSPEIKWKKQDGDQMALNHPKPCSEIK
jgi:hypothetical protein